MHCVCTRARCVYMCQHVHARWPQPGPTLTASVPPPRAPTSPGLRRAGEGLHRHPGPHAQHRVGLLGDGVAGGSVTHHHAHSAAGGQGGRMRGHRAQWTRAGLRPAPAPLPLRAPWGAESSCSQGRLPPPRKVLRHPTGLCSREGAAASRALPLQALASGGPPPGGVGRDPSPLPAVLALLQLMDPSHSDCQLPPP